MLSHFIDSFFKYYLPLFFFHLALYNLFCSLKESWFLAIITHRNNGKNYETDYYLRLRESNKNLVTMRNYTLRNFLKVYIHW